MIKTQEVFYKTSENIKTSQWLDTCLIESDSAIILATSTSTGTIRKNNSNNFFCY